MSAKRERSGLRFVRAVLCAAASVLLLACSVHLYAGEAGASAAAALLLVGVGLLLAALKTLRPHGSG